MCMYVIKILTVEFLIDDYNYCSFILSLTFREKIPKNIEGKKIKTKELKVLILMYTHLCGKLERIVIQNLLKFTTC